MKLTVCFKTIAEYGMLSEEDWKSAILNPEMSPDTSYIRRSFNCYDESALEMGLALEEGNWDRTALTIDTPKADLFLRHLYAVGYDRAVRIDPPDADLRFNPGTVARIIAKHVVRNSTQLVILGTQGGEGDNRQTGYFLAEILGWPCIREVTRVTSKENGLEVESLSDNGTLIRTIALPAGLPAVLIVGNSIATPLLRLPNLAQKLAATKKEIPVMTPEDLSMGKAAFAGRENRLVRLERIENRRTCIFADGRTPEEKAKVLYTHIKDRLKT